MNVTISADDSRSIRAVEIAAGARQWLKCRLADGAKAYGVPSRSAATPNKRPMPEGRVQTSI